MFDDAPQPQIPKKTAQLEDIFSGVNDSPAEVTEQSTAKVPAPTNPPVANLNPAVPAGLSGNEKFSAPPIPQIPKYGGEMVEVSSRSGSVKKIAIIAVIAVLVIVAAVLLSSLIMRSRKAVSPVSVPKVEVETPDVTTPIEDLINSPSEIIEGADSTEPVGGLIPGGTAEENLVPVDSDRDGLVDSEELMLGTSPRSADTDSDGLSDKDEIKSWNTNPLNPDTDGDGYKDGEEVDNGYDPNGAGKLFEIPN